MRLIQRQDELNKRNAKEYVPLYTVLTTLSMGYRGQLIWDTGQK